MCLRLNLTLTRTNEKRASATLSENASTTFQQTCSHSSQAVLTVTYYNSCTEPPKSAKELIQLLPIRHTKRKKALFSSRCLLLSCTMRKRLDKVLGVAAAPSPSHVRFN